MVHNNFYKILDIIEKPQKNPPSNLALSGRYIFTSEIMTELENVEPGVGGEIQLTDAITTLLKKVDCYGKIISGQRYDIGKEADYLALLNEVYKQNKKN